MNICRVSNKAEKLVHFRHKILDKTLRPCSHVGNFSSMRYFYLDIFFKLDHFDNILIDLCQKNGLV